MDTKVYVFVFLCVCSTADTASVGGLSEPRCYSAFDFEERLLEKMVILQHSVSYMEKQFEKKMDELAGMAEKLNEEKAEMEVKIKKLGDGLKEEQKHKLKELDKDHMEKLGKFDETFKGVEENINKANVEFAEFMNTSIETFKGKTSKAEVAFRINYVVSDSIGPNARIKFRDPVINTNNVYNVKTGEFTAPVGGIYWFSVHICAEPSKRLELVIAVNGAAHSSTCTDRMDKGHCLSLDMMSKLSPSDRVSAQTGSKTDSGDVIIGVWRPQFMGVLVR